MIEITRRNGEKLYAGRIVGGFAWPGEGGVEYGAMPGYCCVMAESIVPETGTRGAYPVYFLDEYVGSDDKEDLIHNALQLQKNYHLSYWYGRGYNDPENQRFITNWNRYYRPEGVMEMRVCMAPNSDTDEISYHFDLFSSGNRPGAEIVFDLKDTEFARQFNLFASKPNKKELTCGNYPAIAAVCYAVSSLRQSPPEHRNRVIKKESSPYG